MSESVFTYGAPGLKFGEGASDEIGYDLSQYDVRRVLVITDRGGRSDRAPSTGRRPDGPVRHRGQRLRRRTRRADRRQHGGSHRACPGHRALGRVRRRRWRVGHRHRQGGEPADHQRRRADGLHQRSRRSCTRAQEPAEAARRRPDHDRHRCRVHHDLRARRAGPEGEDRHQSRAAASHAGRRGPGADPDAARRGHRSCGDGHLVPRAGELHGAGLQQLRPQAARAARSLLRRQPDLGHVVGEGDGAAGRRPSDRPSTTARTPSPVATWRWPRRLPVSGSATRACTSRTPTPTRSRAGSRTSTPTAIRPRSRWCRTAWQSRSPRPRRSAGPSRPRRNGTSRPPSCWRPGTPTTPGQTPSRRCWPT